MLYSSCKNPLLEMVENTLQMEVEKKVRLLPLLPFGTTMATVLELLQDTLEELEKYNLKKFRSRLKQDVPIGAGKLKKKADVTDVVDIMMECFGPEEAVKKTLNILRKMNQNRLAEELQNNYTDLQESLEPAKKRQRNHDDFWLQEFLKTHKMNMKEKVEHIFEGKKENEADLRDVFTELFITEGDLREVNQEHEILQIYKAIKPNKSQDRPIKCNDVFSLKKNKKKIVLTKGIAGVGKTVSVHKFILDWAEGEANQDIDCVFFLPFRKMNCIKDTEKLSLHEFLQRFNPELKKLETAKICKIFSCKLAFIFDGLDESRLTLDFDSEIERIVEDQLSINELFTSLVKGTLLPSAHVWVTSRPAAANQIPPEYVGLFTEVRGFTDQQKEEYFRKRIKDETQASRMISHIKKSRSLYIMCYIPVFCWITATVHQDVPVGNDAENINTTLTEMYIHFLLIQMKMKSQKHDRITERERTKLLDSNKTMILKLAKLAFEQLKKENIVFSEEDLEACGIDVSKDFESTGMLTEIFQQEAGLHKKKVFCFIHLSVQEFLAAVHVFLCYLDKNMDELQFFSEETQNEVRPNHWFIFQFARRFKTNKYIALHDIMFIYSMPGYSCGIRERMLYSSCKNPLLEMVENTLQMEVEKKVRLLPLLPFGTSVIRDHTGERFASSASPGAHQRYGVQQRCGAQNGGPHTDFNLGTWYCSRYTLPDVCVALANEKGPRRGREEPCSFIGCAHALTH
ncbi:unnamed protein product [Leuciscus chuanchicus]